MKNKLTAVCVITLGGFGLAGLILGHKLGAACLIMALTLSLIEDETERENDKE